MKQYTINLMLLVATTLLVACGAADADLVAPQMEVLSFQPMPVETEICGSMEPAVFQLTGGDQLAFDVLFTDENALSQYKIDIHNNFDCHGHGGGSAPSVVAPGVSNQTTDWTVLEIQDLSGTSSAVNRVLNVPQNVTSGNYHFQIQVIDESGNDNPAANVFALSIKNPLDDVPPIISTETPSAANFTVQKGETINFSGQITDDRSLSDGGNGVLYLAYTDLSSGNTFTTDQVIAFDSNVDASYDYDFDYVVPQTLVAGNYRFSLGANDGVRNVAAFLFFEVQVTN